MIPLRDQELIRQRFAEEVKGPVKIDLFLRHPTRVFVPGQEDCPFPQETEQLLTELSRLSPHVDLRIHERGADRALEERYGIERIPATVLRGVVNRPLVFYGLPVLNLFPLLVKVLVWVSMEATGPAPQYKRKLKRLKKRIRLQVFVTPDQPYCTDQASIALALGLGHQHIRPEIIEVSEFAGLAERLGISAVPTTIIDGRIVLPGLIDPETLVDEIIRAAEHQTIAPRSSLLLDAIPETATRLPAAVPEQRSSGEQVRPSGLIIPGR